MEFNSGFKGLISHQWGQADTCSVACFSVMFSMVMSL